MPMQNFSSVRVADPDKFKTFRTKVLDNGVQVVLGILKNGKTEAQAFRFPADQYDEKAVRSWVKKMKIDPIEVSIAEAIKEA